MGKRFLFFLVTILFGAFSSEAQLYVSKKACLANPNTPPVTSPGTGTGTGTTAPASCDERAYFFEATTNNVRSWTWDFGDGTVLTDIPERNPTHVYTTPNTYTVTVTVVDNGGGILGGPSPREIKVGYYPDQPLFDDKTESEITICKGKSTKLDPYEGKTAPPGVIYKWFPNGETDPYIEVEEAGCYSVEVIDPATGCSRSAKINVKLCYEDANTGGGSEKWYFGYGSGLEFTLTGDEMVQDSLAENGSLDPQPEITNPSYQPSRPEINESRADEAAAMVFDQNNRLVLYTDGKKLFSGEDDAEIPMPGGDPFANKNVGAQGLALVPKPVCSACDFINYYLFTVDENTGLLTYSVIDMREYDRKGAVVEANIPLAVNMSGKIIAERGEDDADGNQPYFITAYNALTGGFQSVTVDSLGIISSAQILGQPAAGTVSEGYVAVSPDGSLLAHGLVINGKNHVQIATRDQETNGLSAPRVIDLGVDAPPTVYGLAFSPNGEYLYVTLKGDGGTVESQLLQVAVNEDPATVTLIASSTQEFGALGLGPKYGGGAKYVYVTINNSRAIHYIQAPDEAGRDAVAFTLNHPGHPGVAVEGTPKLGFPNVVAAKPEQEGQGLGANYSGNCMNAPTDFTTQQICDPMKNEVDWVIDGETFKNNPTPSKTFTSPGWKTIHMTVRPYKELLNVSGVSIKDFCGDPVEFTGRVYIKPAPTVNVTEPVYLCLDKKDSQGNLTGTTVTPSVSGGSSFTYLWKDFGGNDYYGPPVLDPEELVQTFYTDQAFTIEVTNNYECMSAKTFKLELGCLPIVEAPSAFTPNGDGINDTFKPKTNFIVRPRLEIYNRWGEQVFQTDNLDNEWDGRYKGQLLSNQLFAYVLRYYARDFPQHGEQKKVGSVLVLTGK